MAGMILDVGKTTRSHQVKNRIAAIGNDHGWIHYTGFPEFKLE